MNHSECFIVGGGPSLTNFDWSQLDDKFVIAINRAYENLPRANIVYFTDDNWYKEHEHQLLQHTGWLVKGSLRPNQNKVAPCVDEFKLVKASGLATKEGELSHGQNSTYAAINLAGIHLGFDTIYLLGIDLQFDGNKSHWHNGHTRVDPESIYDTMLKHFNNLPPLLEQHGVQVFNVNTPENSRLHCFPFSNAVKLQYKRTAPSNYENTYTPPPKPHGAPPPNDNSATYAPHPKPVPPISYRMRQQPITAKQRQEAMAERKRRIEEIRKINRPNTKKR